MDGHLYNDDALELRNFDLFMATLQKCFEDLLADCKARDSIKTISEECRGWMSTPRSFLTWPTDWPEDILIR